MNRFLVVLTCALFLVGCPRKKDSAPEPTAATGVKRAVAKVPVGSDGLTVEQRNVQGRLQMDNKPGSIKHLYVISAMSGQIVLYSTVKGKVTSSGKRLTPTSVAAGFANSGAHANRVWYGMPISIGGQQHRTAEVIQDDGTFGSSIPYLFWWDAQGRYHQHYISGGQILHISDYPIRAAQITINLETTQEPLKAEK
jgi:hypothetical protein